MDGNWSFHKVNYKADSKLFSENITDEYEDVEWVFTEMGDVMQIDHEHSDTIFGSFELELIEECDDYDGGCENIYFIHLYMINGQSVDHSIWEDAWVCCPVGRRYFWAGSTDRCAGMLSKRRRAHDHECKGRTQESKNYRCSSRSN